MALKLRGRAVSVNNYGNLKLVFIDEDTPKILNALAMSTKLSISRDGFVVSLKRLVDTPESLIGKNLELMCEIKYWNYNGKKGATIWPVETLIIN